MAEGGDTDAWHEQQGNQCKGADDQDLE